MHKVGTFHSPTQKEALAHTGFTTFGEPTALPVNVSRYNTISHNYQSTRQMAHRTSHEPVTLDSSKKAGNIQYVKDLSARHSHEISLSRKRMIAECALPQAVSA